jgi:hypothetical protein
MYTLETLRGNRTAYMLNITLEIYNFRNKRQAAILITCNFDST